jgi:tRNA G10  N-methylase Trm11
MIRSVSDNQEEILRWILDLAELKNFDADLTYGNGKFYGGSIPQPDFKFDIEPLFEDVEEACSTDIPSVDESFESMVFDPPFLTYVRSGREGNGNMVMARRFGGYWSYDQLEDHYKKTIREAYRTLVRKGILVFKCQDIVHNHKHVSTHINVMKWCEGMFRLKDLFILTAKHRMPIPQVKGTAIKKQKHARIHHSYFMVLEKT